MLDLMTSTLMIFLLLSVLRSTLSMDDLEAAVVVERQNRFAELFAKEFQAEIEGGEMRLTRNLNLVQITFSDHVLFASSAHALRDRGKGLLRRCATLFRQASETGYEQIQVEGHTDNQPLTRPTYPADNWELSTARALNVVRFLINDGHVTAKTLSANGYAEHRPVTSNTTARDRALNRRIEIRLYFSLTSLGSVQGTGRDSSGPRVR